jgi:hypothetical protein
MKDLDLNGLSIDRKSVDLNVATTMSLFQYDISSLERIYLSR